MNLISNIQRKLKSDQLITIYWIFIIIFLILKILIIYPQGEFINYYAFFSSDSYDWIANGLRLFSNNEISYRNPGLPLIIKFLNSFSALKFLIISGQVVYLGIMYYTYKIGVQISGRKLISLLVPTMLFLNYGLQLFSNYILSDLYAIFFIAVAVYYIFKDKIEITFLLLSISMLFQNFSYFLIPVFVIYLLSKYKNLEAIFRNKFNILRNLIILGMLPLIWHIYKFISFGNPFYTKIVQFDLMYFHTNMVFSYLLNLLTLYGFLPFAAILIYYFINRKIKFNRKHFFLLANLFIALVFWVFFYDWNERRFMYYTIPFAYPLILYAFAQLNKESLFKVVLLMPIMVYFTFLYSEGAFANNKIPIAHNKILTFSLKESRYKNTSVISTPITIETTDTPIISLLNPAYSESLRESKKAKQGNHFHKYLNYIDLNYNGINLEICIDRSLRGYWLNAAMLIKHNRALSELEVNTENCDLTNFSLD